MLCPPRHRRPARFAAITGASSGIGKAFAETMPRETDLLLTARDEAALNELAMSLRADGRRVEVRAADLATAEGREAVATACEEFQIDLLVNNAGVGTYARFLEADAAALEQTVAVNVAAPMLLARKLLPGMIERARTGGQRAGLINVSSGAAFVPTPTLAVYGATKAFELSWSEAIAAELSGEPVDILTLCPGATRSEFGARAGYAGGSLPGAVDPRRVARAALRALGRQRTLVLGYLEPFALGPAAAARNLFGEAMARVLQIAEPPRGGRARPAPDPGSAE